MYKEQVVPYLETLNSDKKLIFGVMASMFSTTTGIALVEPGDSKSELLIQITQQFQTHDMRHMRIDNKAPVSRVMHSRIPAPFLDFFLETFDALILRGLLTGVLICLPLNGSSLHIIFQ